MNDEYEDFIAQAAIVVTEDGELDLLLPGILPEDPLDPTYFLFALHFKATNDPDFYNEIMESVRDSPEFMAFLDGDETEETVH